jgi:hypothetical protein
MKTEHLLKFFNFPLVVTALSSGFFRTSQSGQRLRIEPRTAKEVTTTLRLLHAGETNGSPGGARQPEKRTMPWSSGIAASARSC